MNDKEVRKMLENEQIPKELEPENIKLMLDQKAPALKRKKITAVSRFVAIAAACAIVSGTAVHFASKKRNSFTEDTTVTPTTAAENTAAEPNQNVSDDFTNPIKAPYMSSIKDYSDIYSLFSDSAERYKKEYYKSRNRVISGVNDDEADLSTTIENEDQAFTEPAGGKGGGGDYSTTFNQEENVLEADIVKTDGERIYSIGNYGINSVLHITDADDGELSNLYTINLSDEMNSLLGDGYIHKQTYTREMYIYDDMALVIGTTIGQDKSSYNEEYMWYLNSKTITFVAAYSLDDSHECLGIYYQDGYFNDVRISPDGYMYLITNHNTYNYISVDGAEDVESYIPSYGMSTDIKCIEPENIYVPKTELSPGRTIAYSVIGSLDLNVSKKMAPASIKALVHNDNNYGYGTQIYCAPNNLYMVSSDYYRLPYENVEYGHVEVNTNSSHITRIAINKGEITPAASAKVEGIVNDQFSMSEYDGYFRIATSRNTSTMEYTKGEYYDYSDYYEYEDNADEADEFIPKRVEYGYYDYKDNKMDNVLYVLDLELNEIGSIDDFGVDEYVRSVSFSGDKAYITTFRQTDPLYAIDLSDPASPAILSEFKMNGYSSYLQQWSDGLLLGFGPDADDEGGVIGVKLTMFDNSDSNDIKAIDSYSMIWSDYINDDFSYMTSYAVWDRKALLIDPKKNIIAFPYTAHIYDEDYSSEYTEYYKFFSYKDGKLVETGTLSGDYDKDEVNYTGSNIRAIYIGDYVYMITGDGITSADMETITPQDSITFEETYEYEYPDEDYEG
ncbi:MAG: beta-propeller domain-containing protein [Ruminococcus sp.]|uniref:beta-propeller domain-containing protein n=1 Tax=Ruminococcus sp. TaxID=41978 RepID=UPI001B1C4731|nr:beta-propeller domain-containing protein [Ruminococcus sp.]MBO7474810.1 beta-propeller domain-containing protein [Ruminococcus sp.]